MLYWLHGDGQWMTRWHCTNHDFMLAAFSIGSTSIMFLMYCMYAFRNQQALKFVKESNFRTHSRQLRNVFVMCGLIHVCNSVGAWFIPLYWVIVALTIANVIQCHGLLASKKEILAIQRYVRGEQAIQQVENAIDLIHRRDRQNLEATLNQLEAIFTRTA